MTFEAGAVAQRKTQMIRLFEIANEVLDGIPSGHGFDDELVGVGRPDAGVAAFDLPLVEMTPVSATNRGVSVMKFLKMSSCRWQAMQKPLSSSR